jgi:hypothetical protein
LAHGAGKRYKLRTKPMQAQETLWWWTCVFHAPVNGRRSRVEHNYQLNQWIIANNGTPINNFAVIDICTELLQIKNTNVGFSINAISGSSFVALNYDLIAGKKIWQNSFLQSNLNASLSLSENDLHHVIPKSIINPNPKDYLRSISGGVSMSSLTLVRLRQWQTSSLHFGLEYGISFQANSSWEFGHSVGSGKHSSFKGVPVPEVPNIDPHYTFLKLSLQFRF